MAEMAESTSTSSDAAAQRAAEQARLRKERREAKLKAGGSARLDRITGLGGRPKEGWYSQLSLESQLNPQIHELTRTTCRCCSNDDPSSCLSACHRCSRCRSRETYEQRW